MPRPISKVAPDWWDYTTLDAEILADAAKLSAEDLVQLSRSGFQVTIYDTLEEFYCAEALEYVQAWSQATADNPVGICGPIGPTEQLPLVARIVNALDLKLHTRIFGAWTNGSSTACRFRWTIPSHLPRPTWICALVEFDRNCGCPRRKSTFRSTSQAIRAASTKFVAL